MPRPFILFSGGGPASPFKRLLLAILGLAVLVFLFWVGFFVLIAVAVVGIAVAAVNAIKLKLTGEPLFASRFRKFYKEQQAEQERQRGGRVIEGEVIDHGEDKRKD
ncbi:MAG: hypothetical protein ACX931_03695 [Saccharospirillum sp.]